MKVHNFVNRLNAKRFKLMDVRGRFDEPWPFSRYVNWMWYDTKKVRRIHPKNRRLRNIAKRLWSKQQKLNF